MDSSLTRVESGTSSSVADGNAQAPTLGPLLLRFVVALLFLAPVFLLLGYYLVARSVSGALRDPVPAVNALWATSASEHLRDSPVFEQAVAGVLPPLTGNFTLDDGDRSRLINEIFGPTYVQNATDDALLEYAAFVRSGREVGDLRLEVDLTPAMEEAEPAVTSWVAERMQGVPLLLYTPDAAAEMTALLTAVYQGNLDALPLAVALEDASPEQVRDAYETAVASFAANQGARPELVAALSLDPEARRAIEVADARALLSRAGMLIAQWKVRDGLAELRGELLDGNRFDLISSLSGSDQPVDVAADARDLQFWTSLLVDIFRWVALAVAIVLAIVLGLVFLPYWRHVLLWSGVLLSLIGVAVLLPDVALAWLTRITLAPCGSTCAVFPELAGSMVSEAGNDPSPGALPLVAIGFVAVATGLAIRQEAAAPDPVPAHTTEPRERRRRLTLARDLSARSKLALFLLVSLFLALLTIAILPFLLRAESWAYAAAFVLSLLGSATVVIPAPGFPAVMLMASRFDPILLGIAAGVGGTFGELTGYWMGRQGKQSLQDNRAVHFLEKSMARYGGGVLVLAVLVPVIPVDVAGVIAGTSRYPVHKFLLYLLVSKTATSIAILYLTARAFEWTKPYLDLLG